MRHKDGRKNRIRRTVPATGGTTRTINQYADGGADFGAGRMFSKFERSIPA
jgi:hypothetical protein